METIDGFKCLQLLGSGSGGYVWKVRDKGEDGSFYALKIMRPGADRKRFDREVSLLGKAVGVHGIVQIKFSSEYDGLPYFVMEYASDQSIDRFLRMRGGFSASLFLQMLEPAVKGLKWLHDGAGNLDSDRRQFVHRDVKPQNLLCNERGVVLADLGIARDSQNQLTNLGDAPGTPSFMAPEQASDPKSVSPLSDQFSLAKVIVTLIGLDPNRPEDWTLPNGARRCLKIALSNNPSDRHRCILKFYQSLLDECAGKIDSLCCSPRDAAAQSVVSFDIARSSDDLEVPGEAWFFINLERHLRNLGLWADSEAALQELSHHVTVGSVRPYYEHALGLHEARKSSDRTG